MKPGTVFHNKVQLQLCNARCALLAAAWLCATAIGADGPVPEPLVVADPRPPKSEGELRGWLENMVWHHHYSNAEIEAATGLATPEIEQALARLGIDRNHPRPEAPSRSLLVLPYPGGRHPRLGFLEGAIRPQRETKFSVFLPWDAESYVVMDLPEAIWSNWGLTYLAHTHVPTLWTERGIDLERQEWQVTSDGLRSQRTLPGGIAFGAEVRPTAQAVRMELWLRNGTRDPLTNLRVQNCLMLGRARGFAQQTNDNKLFAEPYAAASSSDGKRWIITAWQGCRRTWGNERCPCLHADPQFEECPPGETVRLRGWLSFYQGENIRGELARIEGTGWRRHGDEH
jgi:hypothetical protein